jgi:hypothetical protein
MFKTLYLVDQATLDRLRDSKEKEPPALSYKKIYEAIVACQKDDKEVEEEEPAQPPRGKKKLTSWLKNGKKIKKASY